MGIEGRRITRNVLDLALLIVFVAGSGLAWQAGRERARLKAHFDRLVAAAGELPADDPTMVYLKALDTGDPLHFAWRVHVPANTNLEVRSKTGSGWSGGSWSSSAPEDFIARVRFREDEQGGVAVYTKLANSSSRSNLGSHELARMLREHARELKVAQVGRSDVAVLDPKATKPTVLLRVSLPDSLREKAPAEVLTQFFPNVVELTVGLPGTLP
jgi:hypothetical protein